jgi:hypothetical protein
MARRNLHRNSSLLVNRHSRQFCIFDVTRWAPSARCQCPHCISRREYKKLKQRIYQANLSPEKREAQKFRWRQRYQTDSAWRRKQITAANAWRADWPLAHQLYNSLRRLMMNDGCWK